MSVATRSIAFTRCWIMTLLVLLPFGVSMAATPATGTIEGTVWLDANRDGIQQDREGLVVPDPPAVELYLYREIPGTGQPDPNQMVSWTYLSMGMWGGSLTFPYTIPSVASGTYVLVAVFDSERYALSPAGQGSDQTRDSDFLALGTTNGLGSAVVTLSGAAAVADLGLMYRRATVRGNIWLDANRDGIRQDVETAQPAFLQSASQIRLWQATATGAPDLTAGSTWGQIDETGFSFNSVYGGSYVIEVAAPEGIYGLTSYHSGNDVVRDNDFQIDPWSLGTGSWWSPAFTVDGVTVVQDLGLVDRRGTIEGTVWLDANRDGIQGGDAGSAPWMWVGMDLYREIPGTGYPDWTSVMTPSYGEWTNSTSMTYAFIGVPPGSYVVVTWFDNGSFAVSPPHQGIDSLRDSDFFVDPYSLGYPGFAAATTSIEGNNAVIDLGLMPRRANVSGQVWLDGNRDGIRQDSEPASSLRPDAPPLFATLWSLTPEGTRSGMQSQIQLSGDSWSYAFPETPPGTYVMEIGSSLIYGPTGFHLGTDVSRDNDFQADPAQSDIWLSPAFTVDGVAVVQDLGLLDRRGEIQGTVWSDANRDGIRNASEGSPTSPFYCSIYLMPEIPGTGQPDLAASPVAMVWTGHWYGELSPTGLPFTMPEVLSGTYVLVSSFSTVEFALSPRGMGGDSSRDSDFSPSSDPYWVAQSLPITVTPGAVVVCDLGIIDKRSSVRGVVWLDLNRDGIRQDGEPTPNTGNGWGATLWPANPDGTPDRSTWAVSGYQWPYAVGGSDYVIPDILPGTYVVEVDGVGPASFAATGLHAGTDPARDNDFRPDTATSWVSEAFTLNGLPVIKDLGLLATLAPALTAGGPQCVSIPGTVTLSSTVSDSYDLPLSARWTQLSGPATAVIGTVGSLTSTANLPLDGIYQFRLTVGNGSTSSSALTSVIASLPNQRLIDNGTVGYSESGTWTASSITGVYASTTRRNQGSASASWVLDGSPGWYQVDVWVVGGVPLSSTGANYKVIHADGIQVTSIDLVATAPGWRTLGWYRRGNTPITVVLSGVGTLRADAVRSIALGGTIIDDGAAGFSPVAGSWLTSGLIGFSGTSTRYSNSPTARAQWVAAVPSSTTSAGDYRVHWWRTVWSLNQPTWRATVSDGHATTVPWLVEAKTGAGGWVDLGRYRPVGGSVSVSVVQGNSLTSGQLRVDALRVAPLVVVDNGDPGYLETGAWLSSGLTGVDGSSTRLFSGTGSCQWRASLPTGRYRVWWWRVGHATNAATVQVSVSHDGGITNQVLNAQAASGWVDLGTYTITGGTGQVKLGRSSPGTMRADAVRWEPVADEVPVSVPPVSGGG